MKSIEDDTLKNLEGMNYAKSPAEKDFAKCATFGILILFFLMIVHQGLKFIRFR